VVDVWAKGWVGGVVRGWGCGWGGAVGSRYGDGEFHKQVRQVILLLISLT